MSHLHLKKKKKKKIPKVEAQHALYPEGNPESITDQFSLIKFN